jgi:hypothetical protein
MPLHFDLVNAVTSEFSVVNEVCVGGESGINLAR